MPNRSHPQRPTPSPRACLLALATLLSGVVLAGCGASSPSSSAASVGGGSTAAASVGGASTAAASVGGASTTAARGASSGSTASGRDGSGPLAFADCMRANGVPNFPDPNPGGGFRLGSGVAPLSPAFRSAQSKCAKLIGGAVGGPFSPGATTHPSPATLAKLRRIAVCMRAHGISEFPDPRPSVPSNPADSGAGEITDFDGAILVFPSTMNLQAPAYKQALAACGAPPLGLPH
jgi:hypothetical protein